MNDGGPLDAKWQENERELNRIAFMGPLDRASFAGREDALSDEQDRIEFELGRDHSAPAVSRRCSGLP
jgi:hypothetical protein